MAGERALYVSGYATDAQPGIYGYTFATATGALTLTGTTSGIVNPSYILPHPNGQWLYAVRETPLGDDVSPGAVVALFIDSSTRRIERLNAQPSGGDLPCHLALDPSGRWLVVSNYGSGSVEVLPIRGDGTPGAPVWRVEHSGQGPVPGRQDDGPHAHSTNFTPDGRYAIVADLGIDALMIYRFDAATGELTTHQRVATRPGAGPRHLAWHPDGLVAYVSNELDNTVAVYDYDAAAGMLAPRQVLDVLPEPVPGSLAAEVAVAPDGGRVYVSTRGSDTITVFDVAADGSLTRVAVRPSGGRWPRHFVVAPDGGFLLVAHQHSGEVTVLPLTSDADAIGAPVGRVAVPNASCVRFAAR